MIGVGRRDGIGGGRRDVTCIFCFKILFSIGGGEKGCPFTQNILKQTIPNNT